MYKYLDKMKSPQDIKQLNYESLNLLSVEIRDFIIKVVSENGGHLASNLGVVELTLALHKVFESPKDKIIWDVGHQSYVHKILTGRKESFHTLRKINGISGFPKKLESPHDTFDTGHSSSSISVALGIAKSRDLSHQDYSVIAVIGDGALTGGMAFEALNHAGDLPTNIIVILNDNNMSISKNIGSLKNHLTKLRSNPSYFKFKDEIEILLKRVPIIGNSLYKVAEKSKKWLKYLVVPGIMFEELGFKYFGPIDGHNIEELEAILNSAKTYKDKPVLIHVVTKKGKGYDKAEINPNKFHGVSPFVVETGEIKKKSSKINYSNIFGNKMVELASRNSKLVAITAAMPDGTGLTEFAIKFRDRFFDVGITEQHAVTFCAGLAIGGYLPVFAVYSTFLQRAYDQILQDVCMQKLPVVFAIDRAGLVGSDGETHHGVFDISFLRQMPNLTIMSPKDGAELENMLELAVNLNGPAAIRYPRGNECLYDIKSSEISYGKSELMVDGKDGIIIAEGKMVYTALEVSKKLLTEGYKFGVLNIRFIKPLDTDMLKEIGEKYKHVYTIEDNIKTGGLGSGILDYLNSIKAPSKVKIFGYEDEFITHGEVDELFELTGMNTDNILKSILYDFRGATYGN